MAILAACPVCMARMKTHCGNCDWLMCSNPMCRAIYSASKDRWTRWETVVWSRKGGKHRAR